MSADKMAERFLDALRDHPLVADGAMGTQLYERGVLYTQNYEEICVTRPELIKSIHRDYLRAGAQVIETNTFGANRYRLAKFNLEKRVKELNQAMLVGLLAFGVRLTLFVTALRHLGRARTGAYFSVAPFFGALLAVLMGESVSIQIIIAGVLNSCGCSERGCCFVLYGADDHRDVG